MMPPSGTFEYSTTVPEDGMNNFPWAMKSREDFKSTGDPLVDNRLVGWSPFLYIRDAGLPPDPGPSCPAVHRSEIQLVATEKKDASCEAASYFLDKTLVGILRPGDVFHITRTSCGGVGVSAIRKGRLIFAVGEVTAVPLGSDVSVKIPHDLLSKAEAVFRQRDPEFEFANCPIETCIADSSRILSQGIVGMGGYHICVVHGYLVGEPGTPECVSISLDGVCNWVVARASAQLLSKA
jgi:hypothetical protein